MKVVLKILRRPNSVAEAHWQEFPFETANEKETVATALETINATAEEPIRWECSCLQKKCGACAMVINGRPALACDSYLSELAGRKGVITLEPLHKFPVVADLVVDRSALQEHLATMRQWIQEPVATGKVQNGVAYEASRCLQCGCCLEVCPNVYMGGTFYGAAGFVPAARILTEQSKRDRKELTTEYKKHIYSGCGKSLACADICPAEIDIEHLLSKSNQIAIWKI